MAKTLAADLVQPEVLADMIALEWPNRSTFLPMAMVDRTLEGQPGDTIAFPYWALISAAVELAETDLIVPQKLVTGADAPLTIKEAGTGVELTDKAVLTSLGDPMGQARAQISQAIAQKVDSDFVTSAYAVGADLFTVASTLTVATAPNAFIPFGGLAGGIGMEPSQEFAAWIVDVKTYVALMKDDHFLTRDKAGQDATLFRGVVGTLYGIPVVVSERVAAGGPLLVRKGAFVIAYKRQPIVETDRDILARTTVITGNVHYGVLRAPRRGVAKFSPTP